MVQKDEIQAILMQITLASQTDDEEKNLNPLGTIQILRNQEGWVGGVGQMITQ